MNLKRILLFNRDFLHVFYVCFHGWACELFDAFLHRKLIKILYLKTPIFNIINRLQKTPFILYQKPIFFPVFSNLLSKYNKILAQKYILFNQMMTKLSLKFEIEKEKSVH